MKKATIRIVRDKDYFGMARKLKVYIDQQHVGGVRWNSSEDFTVPPGMHLLQVKMDWCKSIPITPQLKEDEVVAYRVLTPADGTVVGLFKQLFDLVFNFSDFFELEKIKPDEFNSAS